MVRKSLMVIGLSLIWGLGAFAQSVGIDWVNIDDETMDKFIYEAAATANEYAAYEEACSDLTACRDVENEISTLFQRELAAASTKEDERAREYAKSISLFKMNSRRRLAAFLMCNLKDANACVRMGISLESALADILDNQGTDLNNTKDIRLKSELYTLKGSMACQELCGLTLAYQLMMVGCELKDGYGCYALAKSWHIVRSNNLDQTRGIGWGLSRPELLQEACDRGYSAAC